MFLTWTRRRACTRLAVAGVTVGALVAVAPVVSAGDPGGLTAATGPGAGPGAGP